MCCKRLWTPNAIVSDDKHHRKFTFTRMHVFLTFISCFSSNKHFVNLAHIGQFMHVISDFCAMDFHWFWSILRQTDHFECWSGIRLQKQSIAACGVSGIRLEWAVQNLSSTHIAAHPENATKCYVLRNIYSCDWIKKCRCIVNCVCQKITRSYCTRTIKFIPEIIIWF